MYECLIRLQIRHSCKLRPARACRRFCRVIPLMELGRFMKKCESVPASIGSDLKRIDSLARNCHKGSISDSHESGLTQHYNPSTSSSRRRHKTRRLRVKRLERLFCQAGLGLILAHTETERGKRTLRRTRGEF